MGFMLMAITLFIFVPMEMAIGRTMRQLHDTRRKAEAAHQAKSDFLANMSHEIRTPMNGVMGMAKLLARSELNDKQRTFADIIVKSGNALLTIINDVLDFSKIEAGEVTLDPEPFNLYEAVEDVAALVSAKAEEKGLEIIARIQPDLPEMVVGDAGRVRQVLTNLVGNGVKFTDEGHVLIDVSGAVSSLNSGQAVNLVIKVIDTGIGIPPENVDKVFDKFSQVNASASQRHEGTGLGLTISQRLVELMGGEIGAESVLGEGSTFWFSFSLPIAGEQAEPRAVPAGMAGAPVLVVDDNGVNRAALIEQFKSWGLQADGAANGDAAIRALTRAADNDKAYELALVDLDMPDMNGAELASRIRSHDRFGSIAIIMLTSVDAPSAEIDFTSTGIEDQLAKPARTSDLYRSLTTILEKRRANAVPPAAAPPAAVPSAAALPAGGAKNGLRSVHKGTSGKVVQIAVGDQTTQQLVEQALMQADHTFFVVDNSMIAAALVRELQPSLVIAELPGSGEDGMDLVMAVRVAGAETGKQIPFVGLADPADGNTLQWIDAGVTRVVNPPVLPDHLRQMIDSLMQDEEIDLPAAVGA
jgi:nitrogen-specific signal transduction histidine kinase/CheY-like chemotaxis protein